MLSLEDKIDKIWNVVMKGGDAPKVLAMSNSTKAISLVTTVKKRKENVFADVIATGGKLMDMDYATDKGAAEGFVLSSEVKTGGPRVRTRNKMKNQAGASGIEVFDTVVKGQKLAASEMEAVEILNNM